MTKHWMVILFNPLPKHIDEEKILLSIDPKKDVDGFHPLILVEWH